LKTPWLLLSVLVHGSTIGVCVAVAALAGKRTAFAPRIELQLSHATAPAPVPEVVLPSVAVEAQDAPPFDASEPPAEPFCEPQRAVEVLEPGNVPPRLTMERIRQLDLPGGQAVPVDVPVVEPPPAPAQADVEASPCADNPPPLYPANERALSHEGTVVVAVCIDTHGLVIAAELASPSPHPGLNREALRAVRSWRFEPAQRGGVAVEGRIEVPVVFCLRD